MAGEAQSSSGQAGGQSQTTSSASGSGQTGGGNTGQSQAAGGSTSEHSSQGSTGQQTTQQTGQTQAQTASRPDYIPSQFWDDSAKAIKPEFGQHYSQMATRLAAEDVKVASRPQKPDDYKIELPTDFKPPAGVEFKFNDADPLLAQARTVAHEAGIPQETFSKLLGLYAGAQVATEASLQAARQAELAKLGPTATARNAALETFFKAALGEKDGMQLMSRAFLASDFQILEKIVGKLSSQGAASFNGGNREAPANQGARVSDEVFAKMSAGDRLNYARQFPQPTAARNGRTA